MEELLILEGAPHQMTVVFMHNIATGHEKTHFQSVGPNNTDLNIWQQFSQQCLLVTDMTFDEATFNWNEIDTYMLQRIAAAVSSTLIK